MLVSGGELKDIFHVLQYTSAERVLNSMWLPTVLTTIVNLIAAMQAFMVSGKTRECCFSRSDSWLRSGIQWLIGPFVLCFIFILLIITFLVQFFFSAIVLNAFAVIELLAAACSLGSKQVESLLNLLQTYFNVFFPTDSVGDSVSYAIGDVMNLCLSPSELTSISRKLTIGALICMFSQVFLMVITYGNIIKVIQSLRYAGGMASQPSGITDYGGAASSK